MIPDLRRICTFTLLNQRMRRKCFNFKMAEGPRPPPEFEERSGPAMDSREIKEHGKAPSVGTHVWS